MAENLVSDPFKLIHDDLQTTKDFAINNILQTEYAKIQEASHYNLKLKGKNFRSAILFSLAWAIYANNPQVKQALAAGSLQDGINNFKMT